MKTFNRNTLFGIYWDNGERRFFVGVDLKRTEKQFRKCRSKTKKRYRGKELKGQCVKERRHITVNSDTVSLYNKIRVLKVACIKTEILDMEVLGY